MITDFRIVSLDIETSTPDPNTGKVLSIAMVDYETRESGYWEISYPIIPCDPKSMEINKIDLTNWHKSDLKDVCAEIRIFLMALDHPYFDNRPFTRTVDLIPMGMNVGSFDVTYLRAQMPDAISDKFGYRSLDLNAVIFAQCSINGNNFHERRDLLKKAAQTTVQKYNPDLHPHHALFDALANCEILDALLK